MPKTLEEMTKQIVEMFDHYESQGTAHWTYKIAALDLSYQLGSLAKRILQLDGERYTEGLSKEEIKAKISDELADILAEALFISHELGMDMEQAWERMLASDAKKIEERSQK